MHIPSLCFALHCCCRPKFIFHGKHVASFPGPSPASRRLQYGKRREAGLGPGAEEVGHAYGRARNSVSRMVSKHCEISVATALEVRFWTCPVARTRTCRSIILGSRIVEMGPYCSCVSVVLGSHNFAARAS